MFKKGKVRCSTIQGASDDNVINEGELHLPGGFEEVGRECLIVSARGGVAGRVIVSDDEGVGLIDDDGAEDIANVGNSAAGGSTGKLTHTDQVESAVEGENEKFFGGKVSQLGREEIVDIPGVFERR